MLVPGRSYVDPSRDYRYGFQGQEKDDELKGEGNSLNYTFRMHDPRVGRFFAVDPLEKLYSHNSPYSFSENSVILFVELEGKEKDWPQIWKEMKQEFGAFLTKQYWTNLKSEVSETLNDDKHNVIKPKGAFENTIFIGGQIIAGFHPVVTYNNLHSAFTEGKDTFGNEMNDFDKGLEIAGAIPLFKIGKLGKLAQVGDKTVEILSPFVENSNKIIEIVVGISETARVENVVIKGADNVEKFIVIGRGQAERVDVVKDQLKSNGINVETITDAFDSSKITPELNQKWINEKLKQGYGVIDIGLDPKYTKGDVPDFSPGPYYQIEINAVDGANFPNGVIKGVFD